jgi:hypothetical protein
MAELPTHVRLAGFTFEIEDDAGTPFFTVRVRCDRCGAVVSERRFDAREEDAAAGGEVDARVAAAHLQLCSARYPSGG